MQHGFWYTLASYLFEIPVERRQSRYSGEVAVSFHRGQYKLSSSNAVYSFGKNYTSFSVPFQALEMHAQEIPAVLVIGFGLGSVVDLLEDNLSIRKIVAVEIDEVIIELAQKYSQSELMERVTFVHEDVSVFLQQNKDRFDLVLFDVFVDAKTPVQFMNEIFLRNLSHVLDKNGLLLYSKMNMSHAESIENDQFEKIFARVFPEAFSILSNGNKIFCGRAAG